MRRLSERTRLYISSWYIGSGNKVSTFTRRSNRPFEKIKEIYGEEFERFKAKKPEQNITYKTLSKEEKKEIRKRVKKEIKKGQIKQILAVFIAISITISLILIARYIIHLFL